MALRKLRSKSAGRRQPGHPETIPLAVIPSYNAELDLTLGKDPEAPVWSLRTKPASAPGHVIVSPEYNHSIPGVLNRHGSGQCGVRSAHCAA